MVCFLFDQVRTEVQEFAHVGRDAENTDDVQVYVPSTTNAQDRQQKSPNVSVPTSMVIDSTASAKAFQSQILRMDPRLTESERPCEVVLFFGADELLRKDVPYGESRERRHGLHEERVRRQGLVIRRPDARHGAECAARVSFVEKNTGEVTLCGSKF